MSEAMMLLPLTPPPASAVTMQVVRFGRWRQARDTSPSKTDAPHTCQSRAGHLLLTRATSQRKLSHMPKLPTPKRSCPICHKSLAKRRPMAVTCCSTCRKALQRLRQGQPLAALALAVTLTGKKRLHRA